MRGEHSLHFSGTPIAARFFERIEGDLYRYPAIDPQAFRAAVEVFLENRIEA